MAEPTHQTGAEAAEAPSLAGRAVAAVRAVFWLVCTGYYVFRFMIGAPRLALLSVVDVRRLFRMPPEPIVPLLHEAWPGVLEVAPERMAGAPCVIAFTGTGESPEAVSLALHTLTRDVVGLAGSSQYAVVTPAGAGAYTDARAFGAVLWEAVTPLVAQHGGPFVVIGLSRGGIVALEVGMRIANEQRKVASVLAMSAPFEVPARLPHVFASIPSLEQPLARSFRALVGLRGWMKRVLETIVRVTYLRIAAMILRELRVTPTKDLAVVRDDIARRGLETSAMRSVREFRLLTGVVAREAELFAADIASTGAQNPRFFAKLVWGETDPWIDPGAARAQLERAIAREPRAAEHVLLQTVSNQGHMLFQEADAELAPARDALLRVVGEAHARQAAEGTRRARAEERAQRLQASSSRLG